MGTSAYLDSNGNWVVSNDTPVQTGGGSLTENSVATIHLQDNAVTNPKIVSLDAAKLTGLLDVNRLAIGSIPVDRLVPGTIGTPMLNQDLQDMLSSANGRNRIFYQPNMPPGEYNKGDTWFDTDDGYKIYVYDNGWRLSQDASIKQANDAATTAVSTANGKNKVYAQPMQPTGPNVKGDTWFDTSDGNKIYTWDGSKWTQTIIGVNAIDPKIAQDISNAASAANKAQTDATSSLSLIGELSNDSIITPNEKQLLKKEWDVILSERPILNSQGATYGLTTENTNYNNKYAALDVYLNTTYAIFANLAVSTTIDSGANMRAKFKDYYDARTLLLNAIYAKIKAAADNAQTTANKAVTGSVNEYALGTDSAPTGAWTTTAPTKPDNQAIWVRTKLTYGDGSTNTSNPVIYMSAAGSQGVPGPKGEDGKSYYTWIKYADTPTTGMSDSPTGKMYLGLSENQTSPTKSTNYVDYKWSLIKGDAGVQGPQGKDGQPTYTWIKYATSAAGAGMSDDPAGKTYVGIAHNKTTAVESTNAADYVWSLMQGAPGADGKTFYTWVKYADSPTTGMSDSPAGKAYLGLSYNQTSSTESNNYADYSWSLVKGTDGVTGPPGKDGQPTYTWVKYSNSANGAGMSDDPANMTYIGLAYNKTTAVESTNAADYQWALIKGADGTNGISVTSITPYFLQQASSTPPATPTTNPPTGWSTTEPGYTAGTYLFRTERVLYSNGTFAYTAVSLVSSYVAAQQAMAAANGKNTNYYQAAQPTGGTYQKGDAWFDTDDGYKLYVFDGSVWRDVTDARLVTAIGNSGNKVYYQTSTPTGAVYLKGDMWFDTDDNYKLYVYTGSGWQLAQDSYAAQSLATQAQTSANGKNKTIYSTADPSGVGFVNGDMWYKYDGTGVIGLWFYNNAWVKQSLQNAVFGNIDAAKITTGFLSANVIQSGSITGDKIAAKTIAASNMVTGTINADSGVIANAAITTAMIQDLAVSNAKIASLDGGKIVADTITTTQIKAGTIIGDDIAAKTITGAKIQAGSVTAGDAIFANAAIISANIADAAITTLKVADGAITDLKVSSLSGGKIIANTIGGDKIMANSISAAQLTIGDTTNLVADGAFVDTTKTNWSGPGTVSLQTTGPNTLDVVTIVGTVSIENASRFAVTPGQELYAEVEASGPASDPGTTSANLFIKYTLNNNSTSLIKIDGKDKAAILNGNWQVLSGTIVPPNDAKYGQIVLQLSSTNAGYIYKFRKALANRKATATTIANGAITTEKIAAGAITAASGVIGELSGDLITYGTINAELIQTIPASKLTGTVATSLLDPNLGKNIDIAANASVTQKADTAALSPISQAIANLNASVTTLTNAVRIDSSGITIQQLNNNPGATKFATSIDGARMQFLENSVAVATINSNRMTITNGTFTGEIIVGAHAITKSGEQTVFRWVG